ncbi:MAG TPA: hypothetical protein VLT36_02190, partial [Candidatus Dormibacteraeota bacterium]|nr:hypothetical protein [Candidatus Dormibacteraeota bacterium]
LAAMVPVVARPATRQLGPRQVTRAHDPRPATQGRVPPRAIPLRDHPQAMLAQALPRARAHAVPVRAVVPARDQAPPNLRAEAVRRPPAAGLLPAAGRSVARARVRAVARGLPVRVDQQAAVVEAVGAVVVAEGDVVVEEDADELALTPYSELYENQQTIFYSGEPMFAVDWSYYVASRVGAHLPWRSAIGNHWKNFHDS